MSSLEPLKIDLKGLAGDEQTLAFDLDDSFFLALSASDVLGGALHVSGSIRKTVGFFRLHLGISGTVTISCDRCLDPMSQPISTALDCVVKLGEPGIDDSGTTDEGDEIITVDERNGVLDTAWPIYETVALAIPIQHVHAPGKCNPAMTKALEELSAARSSDEESSQNAENDPRWSELLKLKTEN